MTTTKRDTNGQLWKAIEFSDPQNTVLPWVGIERMKSSQWGTAGECIRIDQSIWDSWTDEAMRQKEQRKDADGRTWEVQERHGKCVFATVVGDPTNMTQGYRRAVSNQEWNRWTLVEPDAPITKIDALKKLRAERQQAQEHLKDLDTSISELQNQILEENPEIPVRRDELVWLISWAQAGIEEVHIADEATSLLERVSEIHALTEI